MTTSLIFFYLIHFLLFDLLYPSFGWLWRIIFYLYILFPWLNCYLCLWIFFCDCHRTYKILFKLTMSTFMCYVRTLQQYASSFFHVLCYCSHILSFFTCYNTRYFSQYSQLSLRAIKISFMFSCIFTISISFFTCAN